MDGEKGDSKLENSRIDAEENTTKQRSPSKRKTDVGNQNEKMSFVCVCMPTKLQMCNCILWSSGWYISSFLCFETMTEMRSWEVVMNEMEVTDDGEKDVRGMTETHMEKGMRESGWNLV